MSRTHAAPDVPTAARAKPPGWRDPRLWVGVALVAVSVVAGARLLGGADDSVTVWSAATDLAPGDRLGADDLVATSVRFEEPADLDRYLATDGPLPDDLQLVRGLGAGELVPAAALGSAEESDTVSLSLSFPTELVPSGIETGSVVELWVVPGDDARRTELAGPVLDDVVVMDAPSAAEALGSVAVGRQLVLGIPRDESQALAELLAASEEQRVRVLGRG
ncbi:hypothetical protein [Nocardioides sp. Soil805]|uniref:hypothetical protein n=1 Tax=Nocardioides sp. Soil805 TaxID=1736416 RepID=UPI0012E38E0D|nr:hypothetical protein [Nocardioides sp. Soil805]